MLYYLFDFLKTKFDFFGADVFYHITSRAGAAIFISLLITIFFGKRLIDMLRNLQVGETVRDLGLDGQIEKKGTPTMGGIIIIAAIVIPTLLFAKLDNVYVILLLVSTLWMGLIGFLDDYIKVFKKNKEGLAGRFKIVGQVGLGVIVGTTLYFHDDVVIRDYEPESLTSAKVITATPKYKDVKSTTTTLPFFKDNDIDYSEILPFLDENYTWILYTLIAIFIITAVSNGANITDGIDGLAAGTSAVIGLVLAIFAYLSGNYIFAEYLNIMFIPNSGEMVIFGAAFVGACAGFLWYNTFPAQVFMGDTGSLSIGGVIAVMALIVRKELLLPLICGVFLLENLSVIIQVGYFKYTKKRLGEGKRVFLMAPLHHHYQKKGIHEAKIVSRLFIISILLAILALVSLKLR